MPTREELLERLEKASEPDNALDIAVEIALFNPNARDASIRANAAGTKVIYTHTDGSETTCLAWDWSTGRSRESAIALLRSPTPEGGAK